MAEFRPARLLSNPHLQTIAARVLRSTSGPTVRRERWETPDGDFVDLDLLDAEPGAPRVLVLHGLEGSSRAGYVVECLRQCAARGWGAFALNFRGCSGPPNRLARSYCSGDVEDPRFVLERMGWGVKLAIGFSLGGNVLLKLLAELGERAGVTAAAAISVPFDLQACATALDSGGFMMRFYRLRFLRTLKAKALEKAKRFPRDVDAARVRAATSLISFDDAVTAPLYGLPSAAAYYAWASSGPKLSHVRTPTLLISAADDPLAPPSLLPDVSGNPVLETLVTAQGGHCGFVGEGQKFFAEARAFAFFDRHVR